METINSNDLTKEISDILRRVREQGESFEIVEGGQTIARTVPAQPTPDEIAASLAALDEMDHLAEEIAASISGEVNAVDMVRDARREL